jgi:ABC-type transport system involved in cytochrome c biogenesis permease subunit
MRKHTVWGSALILALSLVAVRAVAQPAPEHDHSQCEHDHGHGHGHGHDHHHAHAQPDPGILPPATWDQNVVDLFATLPVQDEGRIKPLDTYALFTLLKLNGKRSYTLTEHDLAAYAEADPQAKVTKRLSPVEWLLNVMFYPEVARNYRTFIVDNSEVITAFGATAHADIRDRYSYNELAPSRSKLMELAIQYSEIDTKTRTPVQSQILSLAHNIVHFERIAHFLDFARRTYHIQPGTGLETAFPEEHGVTATTTLLRLPAITAELRRQIGDDRSAGVPPEVDAQVRALAQMVQTVQIASSGATAVALFPPNDPATKEWLTPAGVVAETMQFDTDEPEAQLAAMGHLEEMVAHRDEPAAFAHALGEFSGSVIHLAEARGEYNKVPLEVSFYRGKYLFYSQWLYVLSFILIVLGLMLPHSTILRFLGPISVTIPTILLIVGITLRCIIRGRPPVTTLYETLLFITAVAAVLGLFIEFVNRQRIALFTASTLGVIGMFLAFRYEAKEATDTMPNLVAVLDTNFWLSTHVTTITMGYAAGLLAAALGHIYIFGKRFNLKKDDKSFYKSITRMTYGVIAFCLVFSIVGTILGGIWANYSWGRFWGWDPKENGALMICLWGLIMLHARMGGYIRDLGLAISSIVMGMIVAFSWWGVNLLGVGLHSYGFTSGIMNMLVIFWASQSLVIMMGFSVSLSERARAYTGIKERPADPAPQPTASARPSSVAPRSRNR